LNITKLELPEVLLVRSALHTDPRGWFQEVWRHDQSSWLGAGESFVQDNLVFSHRGVLRGLHFQEPHAQGKLVTVVHGEVFDVAVDIRNDSPRFGRWVTTRLAANSGTALYIPPGFAHGYQVVSEISYVMYKCTDVFHPECGHTLLWNDPALAIPWPIPEPILSDADRAGWLLAQVQAR
jgi:dTDP-4-dehydrorhamnose 3,5-epimerase